MTVFEGALAQFDREKHCRREKMRYLSRDLVELARPPRYWIMFARVLLTCSTNNARSFSYVLDNLSRTSSLHFLRCRAPSSARDFVNFAELFLSFIFITFAPPLEETVNFAELSRAFYLMRYARSNSFRGFPPDILSVRRAILLDDLSRENSQGQTGMNRPGW